MVSFCDHLKHVITVRGQNLVSRTDDDFFLFSFVFISFFFAVCVVCWRGEGGRVYVQNALRVYIQNVPVYAGTTRTC